MMHVRAVTSARTVTLAIAVTPATVTPATEGRHRREIITVRGQSYVSRLPKYWSPPPPPQQRRGYTLAGRRGGCGVNIFWKTRDIGLASYSNNLSTDAMLQQQERIAFVRNAVFDHTLVSTLPSSNGDSKVPAKRTLYLSDLRAQFSI